MNIFISYASSDLLSFRIPDIAVRMENTEKIERVFYWDRDSTAQKSIVKYMEESITASDVILIVCTEASNDSGPVQQETDMAVYLNKRIVPIFQDINDVRLNLQT
ncbi:MAG: toll/interleukin-1 receptor domain-containing protein [Promethearchaeota archaeon]